MRKVLRRPSPAMVVACMALLVALGGTSVAAVSQLARNSVGTPQLRNDAVTNPKIKNNAVNSAKVANRSLLRVDFAPGQLPAGPVGPQGPAGPAGAAGAPGAAGPRGVIGAVTVRTQTVVISDAADNDLFTSAELQSLCSSGELAISGGASWSDSDPALELFIGRLQPVTDAQNRVVGFLASGANDSGQSSTFRVHALCYTP